MVVAERIAAAEVADRYARDVVAGTVSAGPYVRQAAERHLRDLETAGDRGLHFDERGAQRAVDFISLLNLEADTPFRLEPFQVFIVASLFGWKRTDGHRRFRRAYIEMGKGSGKTPLAAAIGLKGLCADGQSRPEVYSAATTANQARILYRDAQAMVECTPELATRATSLQTGLTYGNGFFRPVSSEGRSLSGPRVHMGLIDEIHEHPTDEVIEKLRAGTKRNLDALLLEITNSGANRTSVCWEDHQYSVNVLDGVFADDSWFAYVCALDEGDDWTDELVWAKANPGIDTILPRVFLQEQVREAVNKPSKQNLVKRLHFCIWTEQIERWLDLALWDACGETVDVGSLKGQPCYGGLDLASRRDFTAFTLIFPRQRAVLAYFWIPEALEARTRQERDLITEWARRGLVRLTPGNITDYDVVRADIQELSRQFQIEEIAFDQWNATQIATQLTSGGATMVPMQQGGASMSEAAKDLEAHVAGAELKHGGNVVLRWMASNVAVQIDRHGNVKLDREHSGDRIDGIAALVMALARAMLHEDTGGWVVR